MPLRRTLATAACVLAVGAPALTSCGFDYATDRIYTPATGVNNRDASIDVLGAVVVSAQEGSGTFIASFANNSATEEGTVEELAGDDQSQLTARGFSPIEVPPGGLVNLADEGGIELEGDDVSAGGFVPVTVSLGTGERVEMKVPVVTNCGYYEGLDGPSSAEQCEAESEESESAEQ
jgi:hypothetical protein